MKLRMVIVAALALSGCGGSGASVPAQFVGTWGADCGSPYVKFGSDGTMRVFPDNADYTLKSAVVDGNDLKVSYTAATGETTDVYENEGNMLRLTKTIAGGQEATWDKQPMGKCS